MFFNTLEPLSSPLPADHQRFPIDSGVAGTAQTITIMQKLVNAGKRDQRVRQVIGGLIQSCAHKDFNCQAQACFNYVQHTIKYVYDPVGVETLATPYNIIQNQSGDCDDKVVLLASMLENIGIRCEFVTLKADATNPDEYSHVYLYAYIPGTDGPTSLDTTMMHPFGWEPPEYFGKTQWPASTDEPEDHDVNQAGLTGVAESGELCMSTLALSGLGAGPRRSHGRSVPAQRKPAKAHQIMGLALGSLGMSTGEVQNMVQGVVDGSYADELRSAKIRAQNNVGYTYTALSDAQSNGDQDLIDAAQAARDASNQEMQDVNAAISAYSDLANEIQTYSYGALKPAQLSGLGVFPVAIVAVAASAAVIAAAAAFSYAYSTSKSSSNAAANAIQNYGSLAAQLTKSGMTPEQVAQVLEATAVADQTIASPTTFTSSLGTIVEVAAVAALAYFGFKMWQKRRGGK